jgi:hypothetical protein
MATEASLAVSPSKEACCEPSCCEDQASTTTAAEAVSNAPTHRD